MGFFSKAKEMYRANKEYREMERKAAMKRPGMSVEVSERRKVIDGAKLRQKADRGMKTLKQRVRKAEYADGVERAGVYVGGSRVTRARPEPSSKDDKFQFGGL